jgi:RNA polymerase sigma factor (sigma-70 family)
MRRADLHLVPAPAHDADQAALARVAAGDLGGLGELYDRYAAELHAFVRRFDPGQDAEDVVQTVFLRVVDKAASFDTRSPTARAWLFGIAIRVLRERRRALGRWVRALLAYASEPPPSPGSGVDASIDIERGLGCLSPSKRLVLLLSEVEGLTCPEIAELLGIPVGTVWTRLHHARRRLLARTKDGGS